MRFVLRTLVVGSCLVLGAAVAGADDVRGRLVDVLASDAVDRVDFTATSFESAMALIETAAEVSAATIDATGGGDYETVALAVVDALNDFTPRTDGFVPKDELKLVVLDGDDARNLGELIGISTNLVIASPDAVRTPTTAAEHLFRGVVLDIEEGIPPLEQLLEHVRSVAGLPAGERDRFLR